MGSGFRSHDSCPLNVSLGTQDVLDHSGFSYEERSSCKHPRTVTEQFTTSFLVRVKQNPFPRAAPREALHGCCEGFGRNPAVVETILTQPLLQAGAFAELLRNPTAGESGLQIGALCAKLLVLGLDVILAVFAVMLQGEAPMRVWSAVTPISLSLTTPCAR